MLLKSVLFFFFLCTVLALPRYEQRMTFGGAVTVGSAEIGSPEIEKEREREDIEVPTAETVVAPLCNLTCIEDGVEWICCEEGETQYPPAESAVSAKAEDRKQYEKEMARYNKVHRLHRLFQMIVHLLT